MGGGLSGAGARGGASCEPVVRLCGRESIFSETHTSEFCGIGRHAQKPAGPCAPLRPGRWVYEGRASKKAVRRPGPVWGKRSSAAPGSLLRPLQPSPPASCEPVARLCGRESIFSETHTNGFCGIGKLAQKPAGPCAPLRPGRWVYEEEQAKSQLLWGGCPGRPGHLSTAAFAGRFSPISSVAALAWCPTVCRGTDDCGEHHPSTVAALAF